jgi:hypothetical protein
MHNNPAPRELLEIALITLVAIRDRLALALSHLGDIRSRLQG